MVTTRILTPALDRVLTLNRALDAAFNASAGSQSWVPPMDIVEHQDTYLLHLELPGVKASDVEITLEKNVLTIKGKKERVAADDTESTVRVHAAERLLGTFARSVRLPEFVDGDGVVAKFTDGVLTITLPKAKAAQSRRVEIRN
jgi:HSP20 family protein